MELLKINALTSNDDKLTTPICLNLFPDFIETRFDIKLRNRIKIDTGDVIMDEIKPVYEETSEHIDQYIIIDKQGIVAFGYSRIDDYFEVSIESITNPTFFSVQTSDEAVKIINILKAWKYGY